MITFIIGLIAGFLMCAIVSGSAYEKGYEDGRDNMYKIENYCLDCNANGLHCIGDACGNKKVRVYYCDRCGEEIENNEVYDSDYEDLCEDCYEELNEYVED